MLDKIKNIGVEISFVTLHVGAGTFLPVKDENIKKHKMHAEYGEISQQAVEEIKKTQKNGGRIIPVGTTALRLLETAAQSTGKLYPSGAARRTFLFTQVLNLGLRMD